MKSHRLILASAFAAALCSTSLAFGQGATIKTNPGLDPATGQINPGDAHSAPSSAPPGTNTSSGSGENVEHRAPAVEVTAASGESIPSPKEARAALLAPDSKDPALGPESITPAPATTGKGDGEAPGRGAEARSGSGSGDVTTQTQGHAAIGGPLSPGNNNGRSGGGVTSGASNAAAAQSGQQAAGPQAASQQAGNGQPGPIGATGQMMPAKFSQRNATLDRLPIMAWPLPLNDEQLRRIYQAVMADKAGTAIDDGGALRPASELSLQQADAMQPIPREVADIDGLQNYKYLKTANQVFLVTPATRTVADVITN